MDASYIVRAAVGDAVFERFLQRRARRIEAQLVATGVSPDLAKDIGSLVEGNVPDERLNRVVRWVVSEGCGTVKAIDEMPTLPEIPP